MQKIILITEDNIDEINKHLKEKCKNRIRLTDNCIELYLYFTNKKNNTTVYDSDNIEEHLDYMVRGNIYIMCREVNSFFDQSKMENIIKSGREPYRYDLYNNIDRKKYYTMTINEIEEFINNIYKQQ